jgi:LysR family cys regulon transcriptional activator
MNLQQMRYLCEIERCRFNLSEVARHLHTSQPGISRQIHELEGELGFEILLRQGKRIVGWSPQGTTVLVAAKRIISEAGGLRQMSDDYRNGAHGRIRIATTHFHARYTLLDVVLKFRKAHPNLSLILNQSDPDDIARSVASGDADLGISAAASKLEGVMTIPCQSVGRILITPVGHPLLKIRTLTLESIADYPLIVYNRKLSGGWQVMEAFEKRDLRPMIVLTATDADVIKAYVAGGLGVAVVQQPVFDARRDELLRKIDVSRLFEAGTTVLMLRQRTYVSDAVGDFIRLFAPRLDLRTLQRAAQG